MARVIIIGLTPASLEFANDLSSLGFLVTCLEQTSEDCLSEKLKTLYLKALSNGIGVVFSTYVKSLYDLGQDKGIKLETQSIKMTVPFVVCSFSRTSKNAEALQAPSSLKKNLYFLEPNQSYDLTVFIEHAQRTRRAIDQEFSVRPKKASHQP